MNTIRSLVAKALLQTAKAFKSLAAVAHSETVDTMSGPMGLGGPGPWTPGK